MFISLYFFQNKIKNIYIIRITNVLLMYDVNCTWIYNVMLSDCNAISHHLSRYREVWSHLNKFLMWELSEEKSDFRASFSGKGKWWRELISGISCMNGGIRELMMVLSKIKSKMKLNSRIRIQPRLFSQTLLRDSPPPLTHSVCKWFPISCIGL